MLLQSILLLFSWLLHEEYLNTKPVVKHEIKCATEVLFFSVLPRIFYKVKVGLLTTCKG